MLYNYVVLSEILWNVAFVIYKVRSSSSQEFFCVIVYFIYRVNLNCAISINLKNAYKFVDDSVAVRDVQGIINKQYN